MPTPRQRSRSLRKIFKKVPGGAIKIHYERRKPKLASCANCGKSLHGTLRELPFKMKKIPKTKKRPERPFGGILCSACMRQEIISKVRNLKNK